MLGAALVCASASAWAQAKESADNKAAAKEHYTRGTSFYDLGRYDDAIKEFEAAYQLKNDPAFLYNLAQSYRQAGNHERALHFYKTYLRYVPKAPNRADIEEKIKTEEQLAAQQPGTTPPAVTTPPPVITTPPVTTPPGNEPSVNVPPPGTTTAPPPGYTPPPGTEAATPPGYAPAATPAAADPGRKFRIAGAATAAVGAALYVVGIIEWRRAVSASKDVESAATFDPEAQRRGQSAETAQWWLYTLGTVAVGAGAGLWFYGNHVTAAAETTTWRVSLAPVLTPNEGGATLRITY